MVVVMITIIIMLTIISPAAHGSGDDDNGDDYDYDHKMLFVVVDDDGVPCKHLFLDIVVMTTLTTEHLFE